VKIGVGLLFAGTVVTAVGSGMLIEASSCFLRCDGTEPNANVALALFPMGFSLIAAGIPVVVWGAAKVPVPESSTRAAWLRAPEVRLSPSMSTLRWTF
jgi:hypothetical protein